MFFRDIIEVPVFIPNQSFGRFCNTSYLFVDKQVTNL